MTVSPAAPRPASQEMILLPCAPPNPAQVNNVYIFPGVSFGAISCQASTIPERFFLVAAQVIVLPHMPPSVPVLRPTRRSASPEVLLMLSTRVALVSPLIVVQAVANSLDNKDLRADSVVPDRSRIREVSLNVAVAVCLEAQALGLAACHLGTDKPTVKAALEQKMWAPPAGYSRL